MFKTHNDNNKLKLCARTNVLASNDVRQQNILVLYNRHHKQSQHVSPIDVVDQSLQGLFIP